MLLRVLSDVHSNLPALEAVLSHADGSGADCTVCLGDVVGYGGDPSPCIRVVRAACDLVVAGNHDLGAGGVEPLGNFGPAAAVTVCWNRKILDPDSLAYLAGLPLTAHRAGCLLCHSFPPDPGSFTYILHSSLARKCCTLFPGIVMLTDHTHVPGVWRPDGSFSTDEGGILPGCCVVAAGSVGQPRDADPRAAYLLLDTDSGAYRHVRVEYDVDRAAESIRAAGLPDGLWMRLYR